MPRADNLIATRGDAVISRWERELDLQRLREVLEHPPEIDEPLAISTDEKTVLIFAALALPWASYGRVPLQARCVVVPYVGRRGRHLRAHARAEAKRIVQARLRVENKPGANGGIGSDFVAKSAPTATRCSPPRAARSSSTRAVAKVPYDPVRDFVPVAQATVYQYVLVTLANSPLRGIETSSPRARQARRDHLRFDGFGGGNHWRVNFLP